MQQAARHGEGVDEEPIGFFAAETDSGVKGIGTKVQRDFLIARVAKTTANLQIARRALEDQAASERSVEEELVNVQRAARRAREAFQASTVRAENAKTQRDLFMNMTEQARAALQRAQDGSLQAQRGYAEALLAENSSQALFSNNTAAESLVRSRLLWMRAKTSAAREDIRRTQTDLEATEMQLQQLDPTAARDLAASGGDRKGRDRSAAQRGRPQPRCTALSLAAAAMLGSVGFAAPVV